MKILIAGQSAFGDLLIDKLNREKHDIYTITGKNNHLMSSKYVNYNFDLVDEKLRFIIYSIMPDVIVFLGAYDGIYDFSSEQSASMKYISGLSNLLIVSDSLNIPYFVYISSASVYGTKQNVTLTENMEIKPEDTKSLIISQGESLCINFSKLNDSRLCILRLSDVYGLVADNINNNIHKMFLEAMNPSGNNLKHLRHSGEVVLSPVYVSDAIDAVYKAIVSDKDENGIFNVSSSSVELSYISNKIKELTGLSDTTTNKVEATELEEMANTTVIPSVNITVDSTAFSERYGYKSIVDIDTGLTRWYRALLKKQAKDKRSSDKSSEIKLHKKKKLKINLFPVDVSYVIILAVLLIVTSFSVISLTNSMIIDIDFMILYIIIGFTHYFRVLLKNRTKERKFFEVVEYEKQIHEKKKNERSIFRIVTPILENLVVFATIAILSIFVQTNPLFSNVNFMVLYIVIIAMTFGMFQASLSVLLSSLFIILNELSKGTDAFRIFIDIGILTEILELLIIGVICGNAKDRMISSMHEKNQLLEDNQNELETIYKINDLNIQVKQTLDDRLKNYEDSLAKIYSIVDKLNFLQPDAIFFSAVGVIMEIMNSNDVSIYIVTGDNFKMCRLMAKTPTSIRAHKKSVPLTDFGELADQLMQNKIYVNNNLNTDMPMMAAPILSNGKLVSIVMLWSVDFENLTIYNTNRFFVLSQLISSIIERAYVYTQGMNESRYIAGTNVLTGEAFAEVLKVHKDALKNNTSSYVLINISCLNPDTGEKLELNELSLRVQPLLRTTDYLGEYNNDDTKVSVLLTNTNVNDTEFIFDRLSKKGIDVEVVSL